MAQSSLRTGRRRQAGEGFPLGSPPILDPQAAESSPASPLRHKMGNEFDRGGRPLPLPGYPAPIKRLRGKMA